MTKIAKYQVVGWNQVYKLLLNLSKSICKSGFKPEVIVGVSRGGWLPGRVLSDLLENKNLANVKIESYFGVNELMGKSRLTQTVSIAVLGKKVLIVDEVADSGRSLQLITKHILEQGASEVKTAVIYFKDCCSFKPNYYVKETAHWVIFPWEIKETIRTVYEKYKTNEAKIEGEIEKLSSAGVSKKLIARFLNDFSEVRKC